MTKQNNLKDGDKKLKHIYTYIHDNKNELDDIFGKADCMFLILKNRLLVGCNCLFFKFSYLRNR